jgi:glycine cleavage system protein P-like pyridoxal-binding family
MRMRDIIMEGEESKNVTINIPITITIPAGGGMPTIGTIAAPADVNDLPDVPVYVSPLQQELELLKQQGGKKSKVINQAMRNPT